MAAETVPVIVDGISQANPSDLSRCIYFSISADDPAPGWQLGLANLAIPFVMLGLQGIIHRPSQTQAEFSSPDDINGMIDAIEGTTLGGELIVDTGVIWVPTVWLDQAFSRRGQEASNMVLTRGALFRFDFALFTELWRFADNRTDLQALLSSMTVGEPVIPRVVFSPAETTAFAKWSALCFQAARSHAGPNPSSAP